MVSWWLSRAAKLPAEAARNIRCDHDGECLIMRVDHAETDDHGACSLPRHTIRERID
jgi:hypothetical protein